jgi:hypothetical protein
VPTISERDFILQGLRPLLGREPTEEEIEAVQEAFAHTNIRSLVMDRGLARLKGEPLEEWDCFVG